MSCKDAELFEIFCPSNTRLTMARIHFAPRVRLVLFDKSISPSLIGSIVTTPALILDPTKTRKIRKSPAVVVRRK